MSETNIEKSDEKIKSKKIRGEKHRKWFYTLYDMDINWEELFTEFSDLIRFIGGQKESCPSTGRLHWQGVIHMYDQTSLKRMRLLLGMRGGKGKDGYLAQQKGSMADNFDPKRGYCVKTKTKSGETTKVPGTEYEFGTPSKQGVRTDLRYICKCIREGYNTWQLENEFLGQYQRYHKYFMRYRAQWLKEQAQEYIPMKVTYVIGKPGVGKTKRFLYDDQGMRRREVKKYSCKTGLKWFPDYTGQKTLIFDELTPKNVNINTLLDLLEGHERCVEYKGGHTYLTCNHIVITSNYTIDEILKEVDRQHHDAFRRRITEVINMNPPKKAVEVRGGNNADPSHRLPEQRPFTFEDRNKYDADKLLDWPMIEFERDYFNKFFCSYDYGSLSRISEEDEDQDEDEEICEELNSFYSSSILPKLELKNKKKVFPQNLFS